MKEKLKIAVIGGGSSYTPELVEGIIRRYPEMPVQDLYLVDIEPGRHKLEITSALAERMVKEAGLPINIHATLNRREAIDGADFVTTQLRVGLLDARAKDERIPLNYNCIGQETTGAGGFAKALRTIPVLLGIAKDIEELSPNAWMFNFTNPAGINTEAILNHTKVQSIGLCNLPIGTQMQIAHLFGCSLNEVSLEWVGLNHLNWASKILVNGVDVLPEILAKVPSAKGFTMKNIPDFGWDEEFLTSLGMLPCSYLRYFYMTDDMLVEELEAASTVGTRAEVVKRVEAELFELYKDPHLAEKPKQLEQRGGAYYSEAAMNLIHSIYTNKNDQQVVNVRNNGLLDFLPDSVSIEANCVINAQGATPLQIQTKVPVHIKGLIQIVKAYESLTVEAAISGDYGTALHALTIHPLVTSSKVAKQILDDILNQHREYLPQF
ncbi:6-phospho-beta-glucosidase [Alicyclobacillus ferrooxydans]|uniref:Diacetylchitobiose-6-phosphate hydrolase n=1 Tax=Alicyclobacillus ferrooxydans TaxID=471514 RepID=A0A0P9CLS0_9BACL|nr:6-phospho-beta-glucosidase [Alicyclobacillus ferrooxydans]KPV43940.1 diacetylchitobiose-6-phosphate hydrolase [Alicyclobacillus ferrooxydans]